MLHPRTAKKDGRQLRKFDDKVELSNNSTAALVLYGGMVTTNAGIVEGKIE